MKTININLYEFKELGKDAQQRAIEDARQWVGDGQKEINDDCWYWTMKEMEKALGIGISGSRWEFTEERWEEMADDSRYLVRYINCVEGRINNRKRYYLPFEKSRYYHPCMTSRESAIVAGEYCNILTGEWTDATFCQMMKEATECIREGWTIDEFVDGLVRSFLSAWAADIDYGYSDENVRDVLVGCEGDALYLEDGRKYSYAWEQE